jgi:hypothetical protein
MPANEDRLPVSADRQGRAGLRLKGHCESVENYLRGDRRWLVHILAAVEQHEREIISARYPDRSRWCLDAGASDRDPAAYAVMHQGPPNYGASIAEGTCSPSISPGAERRRIR